MTSTAPSLRPGRPRGFTLIELMVTVVVAAILAAVALPNLSEFIQNNARATRMNTLVSALTFARSDAVSQRRTTRVCAATANLLACAGNNQFQNGFIVQDAGTGNLVRAFQMSGSNAFTLPATNSAGVALNQIDFLPTGRATGVTNARFVYCDDRGAGSARAIILSATGSPRISRDSDDNGIDDINGVDLVCP